MTITDNANPFSDPQIPSLAWLCQRIEHHSELPRQQRRDMASACNTTAKWFGLSPSAIPASTAFLRKRFERLHPNHVGVTTRRIGNVKSLLLRAIREAGLSSALASYQCPLSPEWQSLYDQIDDKHQRAGLSRFLRYCTKQGILPAAVDDVVASNYLQALETESLVTNPRELHRNSCRLWNKVSASIGDWPDNGLTVPRYNERLYAIPNSTISLPLQAEIDDYLDRLAGADLFQGPVRPLKPSSLKTMRRYIVWYLSALHYIGEDVTKIDSLSELCRFDLFVKAMRWHWERAGNKPTSNLASIAWTVRCIAVKHLGCDEQTEAKYREAMIRLRPAQTGLSDKNRKALRQFDDPAIVQRFLHCPDRLWDQAIKQDNRRGHLLVQAAIAIELLIYAPIRLKNLADLRLDRHLTSTKNCCHIHLPAEEVKNAVALDFILPQPVSERVRAYLDRWHHRFGHSASAFLFPGHHGAKDSSALRKQITRTLFDYTGIRLSPHQFRHVAAKLLLDQLPGHYEVVRKLLGHTNLSTVYGYYSGAETKAATELYDEVILGLKKDGKPTGKRENAQRRRNDLSPFSNAGRSRKRGGR